MTYHQFFAATKLDVDPEVTNFFLWIYILIFIVAVVFTAKAAIPPLTAYYLERRRIRAEANKYIWFDIKKSVLRRDTRELEIPENSLEYFVCKLVFEETDKPQTDYNIIEAAEKDPINDRRAVEQAVRRVNKKAKGALELKSDLLLRRKEKTFLNDIERLI